MDLREYPNVFELPSDLMDNKKDEACPLLKIEENQDYEEMILNSYRQSPDHSDKEEEKPDPFLGVGK
jgi:hypothetical protein